MLTIQNLRLFIAPIVISHNENKKIETNISLMNYILIAIKAHILEKIPSNFNVYVLLHKFYNNKDRHRI
jgi:hypothetical protein